jgi:hypothetical protein
MLNGAITTREASPDAQAGCSADECRDRTGRVALSGRLPVAEQVDVHERRSAVTLLEVGVDESDTLEVLPADDVHRCSSEGIG